MFLMSLVEFTLLALSSLFVIIDPRVKDPGFPLVSANNRLY